VKKPAILFVGASYVLAIHRKKLVALADQFEVTCATSDQIDRHGYAWPTEGSSFGAIFQHSSSAAIATSLEAFLRSAELRESVAQGQYKRVAELYTCEAVARRYGEFLFKVRGMR
jgi:hypothetical protein